MLLQIEKPCDDQTPLNQLLYRELPTAEASQFQFGEAYLFNERSNASECLSIVLKPDVYRLIEYQRQVPGAKVSKNDYNSTRPFTVSAFFSQIIARLFPMALSAKSSAEAPKQNLTVTLSALHCSRGIYWLEQVFLALAWQPSIKSIAWDDRFADWGESPYYSVKIDCESHPSEVLQTLYALLPLLDEKASEWLSADDLDTFSTSQNELKARYPELTTILASEAELYSAKQTAQADDDDFMSLPELDVEKEETEDSLSSLKETNAWLEESLERQTLLNDALHEILRHHLQSHNFKMVETEVMGNLPVPLTEYMTAVDVVNQIPIHPKRLIYQPPTMCFPVTSEQEGFLEHPSDIFAYYKKVGVQSVICEQKHMGGRVTLLVCKQTQVAKKRFALPDGQRSSCLYRVKPDASAYEFLQWEHELRSKGLFKHLESVIDASGIWESIEANWLLLDCELMPWAISNEPIQGVTELYTGLAAVGLESLEITIETLKGLSKTNDIAHTLVSSLSEDHNNLLSYRDVYRNYCKPVSKLEDIQVAPFHILASDKGLYTHASHEWHLKIAEILSEKDPLDVIQKTEHIYVDLSSEKEQEEAIEWWTELTHAGVEGMVIKPLHFTEFNNDALVQPAIKCRGKDYIRMVYGPNYLNHLDALRQRVTTTKERLAFFEFALGTEGLKRLIDQKPTSQVLECFIATLALECSYKAWRKN